MAQEQLAEYAVQKERDAAEVCKAAAALQATLQPAVSALPPEAVKELERLLQMLKDNANEAQAFAIQQKQDADNLKRQVCVGRSYTRVLILPRAHAHIL